MKSIVVLASHPQFADAVRNALAGLAFRVVHRTSVDEAEPLLTHGLANTCLVDVDTGGVEGTWIVERVLRRAPSCRVIVYAGDRAPEWEEELYLMGVRHVFSKPLRARLLVSLLTADTESQRELPGPRPTEIALPPPATEPPAPTAGEVGGLGALRQFSEILTHSLDSEALVRRFLHLVREYLGVNRAAVFLREEQRASEAGATMEPRVLRPVCAIGLAGSLSEHAVLTLESGIGAFLLRVGRVLRRASRDAADPEIQREFEMAGVEVAVPILGREGMIGAALLDSRLTGEPLNNAELETVFHLLEQVGMALSNIHLHDRLRGSNQLLGDVLKELSSACVVVGPDLSVVHINKSARRALSAGSARRAGALDFGDLPVALGSKLYQVLKTGAALPGFRYEPADGSRRVFDVSLMPIHGAGTSGTACSALLVMEDRTQTEHLQRLEKEADQLRLVRNMADRLAAEIGNAITPLSAYQQLLAERSGRKPDEFLVSLNTAMADGVKRVQRLINQMRFIYRQEGSPPEAMALGPLLEEAFEDARRHHSGKSARLVFDEKVRTVRISCERGALRHAISEILLNGLQANSQDPRIEVRMVEDLPDNGQPEVGVEIEDRGKGFSAEALQRGCEPFFTEKTVGVGLGLTAAKKIADAQPGRLELRPGAHGIVRLSLPADHLEA